MALSGLNGKFAQVQSPIWQWLLAVVVGVASLVLFYNGFKRAG